MSANTTLAPDVVTVSPLDSRSERTAFENRIKSWPFHSSIFGPGRTEMR